MAQVTAMSSAGVALSRSVASGIGASWQTNWMSPTAIDGGVVSCTTTVRVTWALLLDASVTV